MTAIFEEITRTNELFSEAFKRGDAEGVANLYTEAGQLGPANSDFLTGRSAIQGFIQGMMDSGIQSIQLITNELEEFDDTAIEIGRFVLKTGDNQIADEGKFIVIWKLESGNWKLHRDIINSSIPA
tara:strand:+ start:631 stop:1008 length:378 start_codon:yes stop_codon:yes gene_type:complete